MSTLSGAPLIAVPSRDCSWEEFTDFALSLNGYERFRPGLSPFEQGGLADFANERAAFWESTQRIVGDVFEMRCCLFFEQRRAGHGLDFAWDPSVHWCEADGEFSMFTEYVKDLMGAIARESGGFVEDLDPRD